MQAELEAMLATPAERHFFRCHPATSDLLRKFNLPIYYQVIRVPLFFEEPPAKRENYERELTSF